jgi:serine phosphatase RsbU (regulator of sigma subunit)/tetratricopeptide (TPR) repeat protein
MIRLIVILPLFLSLLGFAQKDTAYVNDIFERAGGIYHTYPDSTIKMISEALEISEQINYQEGVSESLGWLSYMYQFNGDYVTSLEFYEKAIAYNRKVDDQYSLALDLLNFGTLLDEIGKEDEALNMYREALNIYIHNGDVLDACATYNNIGVIHQRNDEVDSAIIYFEKAYSLVQHEDEAVADKIYILSNLGYAYMDIGKFGIASTYLGEARGLSKWDSDPKDQFFIYSTYSEMYLKQGMLDSALFYANVAHSLSSSTNSPSLVHQNLVNLHQAHAASSNWELAYRYLDSLQEVKLILENDGVEQEALMQTFELQYEKKLLADSINDAKNFEIQQAEHNAEIEKEKGKRLYLFGGIGIALLLIGFMFIVNLNRKKANEAIKAQRNEAAKQRDIAEEQKLIVEEKSKEIQDSIVYAKRIQEAIMPSMDAMNQAMGDGFVLYLPKDVVAGDFFWMEKVDNVVYYAAADCTGHGVPGAMVSVVCSNALTKALLEENIRDTGELLDRTRELVVKRLAKSGEEVKDGMDISLCALNLSTRQLRWSGANNPVWILRKEGQEIEETKANKQPIGAFHDPKPFVSHEISLAEGDKIYVFTDGYQDQFGGPKGKKFKARQLKEFLVKTRHSSMDEQLKLLSKTFFDWKGDIEQIDDVCFIGVRV